MILTGSEILKNIRSGDIIIDPFNERQLNPNSYNFTLDEKLGVYENYVLDSKEENNVVRKLIIPESGITLAPGCIYLAYTSETIGSERFVPIIRGRSSIGRLGLFIDITADLMDMGTVQKIPLQLNAVQPVMVYPGMQIGQVTFWVLTDE